MKCAYCRGSHDTKDQLEACAAQRIAGDAHEYQRNKELDAAAQQALEDVDVADDGEFFREAQRETYDL